jgi:hypothetical protein
MTEVLLALVPLLLLLGCLLLGHYPGCDTIVRLSARRPGRPRTRSMWKPRRPEAPRATVPSGGLLLAFGIARRPPPLTA